MFPPSPRPKDPRRATAGELLSFVMSYSVLLAARWEAEERQLPAPGGAVPILQFRELGIGDELLLWMMYQAHVEHLRPAPQGKKNRAALQPAATLHIESASAFRLTDLGEQFANALLAEVLVPEKDGDFDQAWGKLHLGVLVPRYDKEDRVFSWGGNVLKCYRQAALNQEAVLTAAEELGWPAWFDDPLPRRQGLIPKMLLHDTVKDLNRRQIIHLVRFRGDGTGTRIGWDYC